MNKEFVPYEQALALKELGFDEPCFGLYHNDKTFYPTQCKSHEQFHGQICSAPLYQHAFRWFRENHRLQPGVNSFCFEEYSFNIIDNRNEILYPIQYKLLNDGKKNSWEFDTYEEAELACLKKLIEIVKNK